MIAVIKIFLSDDVTGKEYESEAAIDMDCVDAIVDLADGRCEIYGGWGLSAFQSPEKFGHLKEIFITSRNKLHAN